MTTTDELLRQLQVRWISQKVSPNEKASEQEVDEFEARYGIRFPDNLRRYFLVVNGTRDIDGLARLWPLDDVRPLSERECPKLPADFSYFVVADYDIDAINWAIRLDADPRSEHPIISSAHLHTVAGSFHDFLEGYLSGEPESVL